MWRTWQGLRAFSPLRTITNSRKISSSYLEINDEVREALEAKAPVVALESSIITHGMPYPNNFLCATETEGIVRAGGAVPATIALLGGKIKVGLTKDELLELASVKTETFKCSRRDFGYVLSKRGIGGTTVAGTLIVANKVGIRVFATGGIGGVHRQGELTFDVSADLIELGRSPVAVVCSGVKSILDIPKTLEYLETQGVLVVTVGKDKNFPAFYCRSSGCQSSYNVQSPKEVASIVTAHLKMGLGSGLLFAVPVPEEFALNEGDINALIEKSMESAKKSRIFGKDLTPFLLNKIAHLTKGSSLKTNMELVKNNAKFAADVAVEMTEAVQGYTPYLYKKPEKTQRGEEARPVVIGGSNVDVCATLKGSEIRLDGRIHEASFKLHGGGVGRNIAEALSKLGCHLLFISAVGADSYGEYLCSLLPSSCSQHVKKVANKGTPQCLIVFDSQGECKMLIGDMELHNDITPEMIKENEENIAKSPLLILDGNLSLATLEEALRIATLHGVPVFYEPADVPIASKPFKTPHWKAIHYITPNPLELLEIANALNIPTSISETDKIIKVSHIAKLVANHIPTVIVTLGSSGLLIARKSEAHKPLLDVNEESVIKNIKNEVQVRHYPVEEVKELINVSGAGDCLASGLIVAMLNGKSEEECVNVGFAAAKASLFSYSPVPEKLLDKNHEAWLFKAKCIEL